MRCWRRVSALGVTLSLLVATACTGSSSKTPLGTLADVGFRPNNNGFSFANYGDSLPDGTTPTNLTATDLRTMFGDSVCASDIFGRCTLNPQAQAWLNSTNEAMAGGHCYGFSVASELLWQQKLEANTFGAADTAALSIADNQTLQRQIAYDWALQMLNSVQSKRISGTPNQVLADLRKLLKARPSDTYTIAIWKRDGTGGHAVTPYQVVNKGSGQFEVLIYDNNYPDNATRAISFDTKKDTWSYNAAINPNEPDELYQGDAVTKSLSLFPTAPGLGPQKCPFCGKVPSTGDPGAGGVTEEIYLEGGLTNRANLIVTDQAGHRLGVSNGSLVNQIPGASFAPVISSPTWTNKITPLFFVPANRTYTLSLDGTALTGPDTETLGIIGPGFNVSVDNIAMRPGDHDALMAAPYATKVSYTASRTKSLTLEVGVSDEQADYAFALSGVSVQPGSAISLSLPAEGGHLTMANAGTAPTSKLSLDMTRYTPQGTQSFSHHGISLAGGDTAQLQFGDWPTTGQTMPLVTTHHGQQTTQILNNQAGAAASPVGPTRTAGPTGAVGPAGAPGATGARGPAGASGATGPSGATGASGPAGSPSQTGPTGPPGAQGPAGATGPRGPQGATGQQGVPGPGGTRAWQGTLNGQSKTVQDQATPIVATPSLPAGQYVVIADLTVAGSRTHDAGQGDEVSTITCWATPSSARTANRDGVRVAADLDSDTQTISLNDLLTIKRSDQIDLVCTISARGKIQKGQVTQASIIAIQVSATQPSAA